MAHSSRSLNSSATSSMRLMRLYLRQCKSMVDAFCRPSYKQERQCASSQIH